MVKVCSVDGCNGTKQVRKGLCSMHYSRMRRNGTVEYISTKAPIGVSMDFLTSHAADQVDTCLKWPFGEYVRGYGQVYFRGSPHYAHRVMCILAHGEPPNGMWALHSCGKGHEGCVNPKHLYWGTKADNIADAQRHGAILNGEASPHAVLTEEQIIEIRLLRGKMTQLEIAARYGIKQQHVSQIQLEKRWKNFSPDVERVRSVYNRMQIALGERQ